MTLLDTNWNDNPFLIFFIIAPLFKTLSPVYCLIFDNNKFPLSTHHQLFTPPFFIPLPKMTIQFNQLLFKNEATAIILCSHTILLTMSNLVLKTTQLTLFNCSTNLLLLLKSPFILLFTLSPPQLPPHVQCANKLDIHPPNVFGTDQESACTAGRLDILDIIVMNYNVTKFVSIPIYSTVLPANNQVIHQLIATHCHHTINLHQVWYS